MQAFRLQTSFNDETENDKKASLVAEMFNASVEEMVVTWISDSRGTTFFLHRNERQRISVQSFRFHLVYLTATIDSVYGTSHITEELRLI